MTQQFNRQADDVNDPLAVSDFIGLLWKYRKALAVTLVVTLVVVCLCSVLAYLLAPAEKTTALRFRLEFADAESGHYPSGIEFSTRDITADPILKRIYEANQLERYFDFQEFTESVFVHETSTALELLLSQYEAKLANVKLNTIDRERIEAEFRVKRSELSTPEYELQLLRPARAKELPPELRSKTLLAILATWADEAVARKGALRYNFPVYSKKTNRAESTGREELIVRLDLLRKDVMRALHNVKELKELPGSYGFRGGEEQISLADLEANLDEISRYSLDPLISSAAKASLANDSEVVKTYLENRLFAIALDKNEARGRMKILEDSLNRFLDATGFVPESVSHQATRQKSELSPEPAPYVPQIDASFLDRVVQMAARANDAELRQDITKQHIVAGEKMLLLAKQAEYYRSLYTAFSQNPQSTSRTTPSGKQEMEEQLQRIEAEVIRALEQLTVLYEEISAYNLNPRTHLYSTISPITARTIRGVSVRTIVLYSVLALCVVTTLFPLGCILHHHLRRFLRQASNESSPS